MGSAIRWAVGILMGFIGAWLANALTGLGFSPDEVSSAITGLEILISGGIMFLVSLVTAKALKRGPIGKAIDPGSYADAQWRKLVAPEVRRLPAEEVKERLKSGTLERSTSISREF